LSQVHLINARASSSHLGPAVRGVVLKEEKVEQEIGGSQDISFEELNPEQDKP
jgi:hypothetical protein